MKKMAIFLMFITVSLYGQTWIRSYQWNDLCPGPYTNGSAEVWNVIPAIGGGYLLQGHVEFSYGDIPAYEGNAFWLIDEAGNIVWRRANDMIFKAYNSIVSNGIDRYYCIASSNGASYLNVYDAEMNFLNHYWFAQVNGYDLQLNDMQLVDDGLVFAGQRNGQGVILKTDFAFNVVWQSNGFYTYTFGFESIEPYNDGWVASSPRCFSHFSAIGDTLWTYADTVSYTSFFGCHVSENNEVLLLGKSSSLYKTYSVNPLIHQISIISDGLQYGGFRGPISISCLNNGNIILLCQSTNTILHCYSHEGVLLWTRGYFSHNYMYFGNGSNNLLITNSGYILFCVWDNSGSLILVKSDSNGNVVGNNDPHYQNTIPYISSYPNPSTGKITFKYGSSNAYGNMTLGIYNIKGQKVLSYNIYDKSGEMAINLDIESNRYLSSGLYLLKLYANNMIVATNKMIIIH